MVGDGCPSITLRFRIPLSQGQVPFHRHLASFPLPDSRSRISLKLDHVEPSSAFINLVTTNPQIQTVQSSAAMAIYSSVPPPGHQAAAASTQSATPTGVDIASWSASAISSLNISSSPGVTLSIPLDAVVESATQRDARTSAAKPRKELARRDSLKKRDALLRGKEGSRRRQRWENGE